MDNKQLDKKCRQYKYLLLLDEFAWGFVGILRRNIALGSGIIAVLRGFLAAITVWAYVIFSKYPYDYALVKKNFKILVFGGVLTGLNWIMLFEAYARTNIPTAVLFYNTAPIFAFVGSVFVLKEKIVKKKVICLAIAFLGMIPASGVLDGNGLSINSGLLIALLSGVGYGMVIIVNKCISPELGSMERTSIQLMFSTITALPYAIFIEKPDFSSIDLKSIVSLLILGVLMTGVLYIFYYGSYAYVPTSTIGILSYIEPISTILLSAIILHETLTGWGIVGAILILGASFVSEINLERFFERNNY